MSFSTAKRFIATTGALAAGLMIATSPMLGSTPAYAQPANWHNGYDHRPPPPRGDWHGNNWHGNGYHNNTGAIVGGALVGLGVGAAIGALAAPPVVYAQPRTYYAPPPVYYG